MNPVTSYSFTSPQRSPTHTHTHTHTHTAAAHITQLYGWGSSDLLNTHTPKQTHTHTHKMDSKHTHTAQNDSFAVTPPHLITFDAHSDTHTDTHTNTQKSQIIKFSNIAMGHFHTCLWTKGKLCVRSLTQCASIHTHTHTHTRTHRASHTRMQTTIFLY